MSVNGGNPQDIIIPVLPHVNVGPARLIPNIGSQHGEIDNPNTQCACWNELVPALHLQEPVGLALTRVCEYHRKYFARRLALSRTHSCDCHYQRADIFRCYACGYCHRCGCDLITTSAPGYHRCTCSICLARCCPHHPQFAETRYASAQHVYLRNKQARLRCAPDAEPVTSYWTACGKGIFDLTAEDSQRLHELRQPGRTDVITEEVPINNRWPSHEDPCVTVDEDRAESGLGSQAPRPPRVRTFGRTNIACAVPATTTTATNTERPPPEGQETDDDQTAAANAAVTSTAPSTVGVVSPQPRPRPNNRGSSRGRGRANWSRHLRQSPPPLVLPPPEPQPASQAPQEDDW